MNKLNKIICVILLVIIPSIAFAEIDRNKYEAALRAMKMEMDRALNKLKLEDNSPPFYIDYQLELYESESYTFTQGLNAFSAESRYGNLNVRVKVGDYNDDEVSYKKSISSYDFKNFEDDYRFYHVQAPIDLDPDYIRFNLWTFTDFKYKKALQLFTKKKETESLDVEKSDDENLPNFTRAKPVSYKKLNYFDKDKEINNLKKFLKEQSAELNKHSEIMTSRISLTVYKDYKFFINSEGTEVYYNIYEIKINASASTIMEDGNIHSDSKVFDFILDDKVDLEKIRTGIRDFIKEFKDYYHTAVELKSTYLGPAIYKGANSGYYLNIYLGDLILANRRSYEENQLILFDKLNSRILPRGTMVIDDPGIAKFKEKNLLFNPIDQEGVKPEKVVVVSDGVFKNFLTTRVPIKNFPKSNGHCSYADNESFAGMTTLKIYSNNAKPYNTLISSLRNMCRKDGIKKGVIFEKNKAYLYNINTGEKQMLKNYYVVNKSKIPALRDIEMFSNDLDIYPMGLFERIISPSILVSDVEIKKTQEQNIPKPILPPPVSK